MKYKIYLLLMMTCSLSIGQETENLFDRLTGIDHLTPEEIEKIKKSVDDWEEESKNFVMPDYSRSSTAELFSDAISYSQERGPQFKAVIKELEKRPKELKKIIQNKISKPISGSDFGMLEVPMLVTLAGYVDLEFQIEIAKITLFREKVVYFDPLFLAEPFILNILRQSKNDESAVLEKLIKEGRIVRGSKTEKQWSILREKMHPKVENKIIESSGVSLRPRKKNETSISQSEAEPKNPKEVDEKGNLLWIISGILTLGITGLLFIKYRRVS